MEPTTNARWIYNIYYRLIFVLIFEFQPCRGNCLVIIVPTVSVFCLCAIGLMMFLMFRNYFMASWEIPSNQIVFNPMKLQGKTNFSSVMGRKFSLKYNLYINPSILGHLINGLIVGSTNLANVWVSIPKISERAWRRYRNRISLQKVE